MLIATVNATSILIAMPVIFRGININPLDPANFSYLLWLLMGYMVVSAVLVVTAGRLGDMYGRTRIYNVGFAIFTLAAIGLSLVWISTADAARLTGRTFFPSLISAPFQHGLVLVLSFSIAASLVAAAASALRGGRFVHEDAEVVPLRA